MCPYSRTYDVQSDEGKNHILKKQYNATVNAHALTSEEDPQIRGSLSRQENTVHDLDNDGNNEAGLYKNSKFPGYQKTFLDI